MAVRRSGSATQRSATGRKSAAGRKKKVGRVAANLPKVKRPTRPTRRWTTKKHNCNLKDICAHLTALNTYFTWFHADYTLLRRAVCNVERQAFDGNGSVLDRFCGGGGVNEPADPVKPPVW